jgi:ABC-type lipoprotein export system ATPase subunit
MTTAEQIKQIKTAVESAKKEFLYVFSDEETGEIKASNSKNILRVINKLNKEGWNYKRG